MLISYRRGQGSIVLRVKILNSSVSTGAGLTGLTSASSGLIISTIADNEATATAYTVAGSTIETIATLGTFAAPTATKCRFKEVDATNHKGVYEIQIADARFAVSNAKSLLVSILGATNAAETDALIPLSDLDPYDAVRAGLTALPNAAAEAAGGLYTRGSGAGQLSQSANGELGVVTLAKTLTTYTGDTPQTGDAYAVVSSGTHGNAALKTLIDALDNFVDTEVAAILAVTDKIDTALVLDGAVYQFTANALELAPTGGSAPTASQIADEVQTRTIAGVTLVATTTNLTNLPAIPANWLTAAGTAADFTTEVQAGLATAANLATVAGYIDTEVASILATVNHVTYGNSAIKTAVDNIVVATGASDLTTKTADSATLTTGSNISGAYTDTASDNDVYWITAPVTPAVGGFGLRQQLVFNLALARIPVSVIIRAYWNGSGQTGELYALNSRTAVYDKLTNTGTNLASRNTELLYVLPLPRDYADSSGGVNNIVTLEFRSTSTNTAHRLRLDQVLVTHVSEATATTVTAPSAADIWAYVNRTLTTPGTEPITPPTAAEISDAVWDEVLAGHLTAGTTGAALDAAGSAGDPLSSAVPGAYGAGTAGYIIGTNLDATVSSRASQTSVDTIDDFLDTEIAAIKAKTDNLPSDPADESSIQATLATIAAYVDTEIAAIKAKTDNLPSDPADESSIQAAIAALAAYVDTEVAAIKAKTDNLPASPAAVGSAMTLDMTQAIASSQTNATVGAALLGMEAQAVGKWTLVDTTLTLYRRDGTTVVRTFTLDAANNPTSRT